MTNVAAAAFGIVVGVVALFQIALVTGAPWGHLTMGGQNVGRLPPRLRLAVAFQAFMLLGLAAVVLARVGLAFPGLTGPSRGLVWVAVIVSGVSLAANLVTKSKWERRIWAPAALIMLVSSLLVALKS
jgi:hypothetical protein